MDTKTEPSDDEKTRAATIVADRLCGSLADPIIRNEQEQRQLKILGGYLEEKGYERKQHPTNVPITKMAAGTFSLRLGIVAGSEIDIQIPVDVVVQPKVLKPNHIPILIEAKSAGDFTNTNKRRKEEATKLHQLKSRYGNDIEYILFLCGYFDSGYLGYEAAEGIDWVWEHRIDDLAQLGL